MKALLLDLDNTLLENSMDSFVPAYLSAISQHVAQVFSPQSFIRYLMQATDAMSSDVDPQRTNMQVFDAAFFPALGRTREELDPLLDDFYARRFPELASLTRPVPGARPLVEWAFDRGYQVAIATNPLFPRTAVEQRLEWAGLPVEHFPFDLVTTYEVMHAAKPHTAYYREIAACLDRQPQECVMVGDEWEMDVQPAMEVGMWAFWIGEPQRELPEQGATFVGHGSLVDFWDWIREQEA